MAFSPPVSLPPQANASMQGLGQLSNMSILILHFRDGENGYWTYETHTLTRNLIVTQTPYVPSYPGN